MKILGYVGASTCVLAGIYSIWIEWHLFAALWLLAALLGFLTTKYAVTSFGPDWMALACVGSPDSAAGYRVYVEGSSFHLPLLERLFLVPRRPYSLKVAFTGDKELKSVDGAALDIEARISVTSIERQCVATVVTAVENNGRDTRELEPFLEHLVFTSVQNSLDRMLYLDGTNQAQDRRRIEEARRGIMHAFDEYGLHVSHAELDVLPSEIAI